MAHTNLGNVLMNVRKDFSGAERQHRKALELGPTAIRYNNLGNVLRQVRKDYDAAERMFGSRSSSTRGSRTRAGT